MIDYEVVVTRAIRDWNGTFICDIVVIRVLNTDEIYFGKGVSQRQALDNALSQREKE